MLTDHDLLVSPFVIGSDGNADGLPTVLLEGMATGIPCIAGAVTAVPEVIDHGRTGWLVDGSDEANIASTIAEVAAALSDDPTAIRAVTDAARDRVYRLHDSTVQAGQLGRLAAAAAERATDRATARVGDRAADRATVATDVATPPSESAATAIATAREMESVS